MAAPALILFAHGSRDPRWAAPFARVLARVQADAPAQAPMLAFLELMEPDLATAVASQAARGFSAIRIVPLFLGQGGHLREDLPRLVDDLRAAHPQVEIELCGAAGEDDGVIAALAAFCRR
jgi:sirohydrochlorin cobaltochelatase